MGWISCRVESLEYFTPDWASGALDDAADEQIIPRYNAYLATLDQSGAAWRLATTVSLNDAYLDRVFIDRSIGRLRLSLITGDLQVGYWLTELDYYGARIFGGEADLRLSLRCRPSEILYDEFSGAPCPTSHAFLLAIPGEDCPKPFREFKIAFDRMDFTQARLARRNLVTEDDQSVWG